MKKQRETEKDRASVPGPKPGIGNFHAHRSCVWIHTSLRWTGEQGERAEILGDVMRRARQRIWEM
jgi:hypothetical protein